MDLGDSPIPLQREKAPEQVDDEADEGMEGMVRKEWMMRMMKGWK